MFSKLFLNGIAYHWKQLLVATGNRYLGIISIITTEHEAIEQLVISVGFGVIWLELVPLAVSLRQPELKPRRALSTELFGVSPRMQFSSIP